MKKNKNSQILINPQKVDWDSQKSYYFFNEKHPEAHKLKSLVYKLPFFSRHIYIFTSTFTKVCILSKDSFLTSAKSVNQHLECHSQERYLISLPLFHVGGLSILARAFCGNYLTVSLNGWSPQKWIEKVKQKKITLSSLVPTQVYDLVKGGYKAPSSLKAIVVGGDSLTPFLYKKARDLNWPLLPSYGLTEACSQVATAELKSLKNKKQPFLKILPHFKLKEQDHALKIKSDSLLKGYFNVESSTFYDPKDSQGWLSLEDRGKKSGNFLEIFNRQQEQIKILGEQVNVKKLTELLEKITFYSDKEYQIVITSHERKGNELNLVTTDFQLKNIYKFIKEFNRKVLPYEKLEKFYCVPTLKKSPLFKIKQKEMKAQIHL